MKNTVTKSDSLKNSLFGSNPYKKHRRRRYRNKNSSSKKKKLKNFYSPKKSNSIKVKTSTEKSMSNWYWSNYRKALQWQDRHKIARWKSCALALLEENRYLLQIINTMQPGLPPEVPVTQSLWQGVSCPQACKFVKPKNFIYHHINDAGEGNDDDGGDDDGDDDGNDNAAGDYSEETNGEFEIEMSEEMMKFFEQSYKHKMEQKKLKEKEMMNNTEQEIKKIQTNKLKRSTEMNLLYGEGASMIIGMETAVQLSFDKYCDTKSPKYWPNIPFRL